MIRQMWRCTECKKDRQWGSIPFSQAENEAAYAREHLETEPLLNCEGDCNDVTRHRHSIDQGVN